MKITPVHQDLTRQFTVEHNKKKYFATIWLKPSGKFIDWEVLEVLDGDKIEVSQQIEDEIIEEIDKNFDKL